jgi:hypothetical protein
MAFGSLMSVEATAARRADERVAAVRDDPVRRLMLAAEFYDQRDARNSIRPYRRAEIAFMRWQIWRGVLFPPDGAHPGSPWWRAVNESLLRDAVEADLLFNGASGTASTAAVRYWIDFLQRPAPGSWYLAHNASIVAGYLDNRDLVALETPLERFFMDVALLRVLYAHSLLVRPRLALGRLAAIGRFLGDPRRRAADLFLSIQNVLPDKYPLGATTIDAVLAEENYLGRLFDYGVIVPRLELLYEHAADDLDEPRLSELCRDSSPVYAWPYEHRHVWRTGRSRRGIALVRAFLGPPVVSVHG